MPVLIIGWGVYVKLTEKEKNEFALVQIIRLLISMNIMNMSTQRVIKITNGVIDALRVKKNYWNFLVMK